KSNFRYLFIPYKHATPDAFLAKRARGFVINLTVDRKSTVFFCSMPAGLDGSPENQRCRSSRQQGNKPPPLIPRRKRGDREIRLLPLKRGKEGIPSSSGDGALP